MRSESTKPDRVSDWCARVFATRTESDVLKVVNTFLATLLPSDLARLPERCRVTEVKSMLDVAQAAVELTRYELALPPDDPGSFVAFDASQILNAAQLRLRQIVGWRTDPGAG